MKDLRLIHTVKFRLIVFSALLVLIPTIIIEIVLVKSSTNLIKEEVENSIALQLNEASQKIDDTLDYSNIHRLIFYGMIS